MFPIRNHIRETLGIQKSRQIRRLVSAATFAPGARTDLKTIGQSCRDSGAFFLVDGAQAVGVLDLNVCRDLIDGLAFSTQKGLLGLYGLGFLYCRSDWAEQMSPRSIARFSVDTSGHEADFDPEYKLRRSALRFDLGNYNFLAATAVEPSLDLLLRIGTPAIDRYLSSLSASLIDGLVENDLPVVGGRGKAICNIVTAGTPAATNGSAAGERYISILQALVEAGIVLSSRRGLLRFSFHVYNTNADVERVLHAVKSGDRK
ncbi:aminotransferase class V-fold PLP-dependent enzyme [Labrenzia sp. OB1]|uniref:aminotransferase class V-fold PLP-dependent enzyme n=1 Tax=Labrenzia sp. OB1 TaxID=1561204 RepID=UPI000A7C4DE5|nr:aminotransferase class V-fold PLP-dependent enzyme [Labrenzia sp. OB1]